MKEKIIINAVQAVAAIMVLQVIALGAVLVATGVL